jgi:hypothetical protein
LFVLPFKCAPKCAKVHENGSEFGYPDL